MRLRTLAVFGAGYIFGTRAGRERYGQIVAAAQGATKRLEDYSGKLEDFSGKMDSFSGHLNRVKTKLQDFGAQ